MRQAWACSLQVVYCVGESREQRDDEKSEQVIEKQLQSLKQFGSDLDFTRTVIVYEPVWALCNSIASADQTQDECKFIRDWIKIQFGHHAANQVRIVFGGPVTETNLKNFIKLPDIDGFLIGTMSLMDTFPKLISLADQHAQTEFWI